MTEPAMMIMVCGVPLPAGQVAEALLGYVDGQLTADRRRPGRGPGFNSTPWTEASRRLKLSRSGQLRSDCLPPVDLVSCTDLAGRLAVAPRTVRRWATDGRILGARQVGREWLVPSTATSPDRRRNQ